MSRKGSAIVTAYYNQSDRMMIVWHLDGTRQLFGDDVPIHTVAQCLYGSPYVDDDAYDDAMQAINDWQAAKGE